MSLECFHKDENDTYRKGCTMVALGMGGITGVPGPRAALGRWGWETPWIKVTASFFHSPMSSNAVLFP